MAASRPPLMRKIQDDMDISGETATLSDFGVVETTDYDHRRCFDSKIQPVREAPQQRPPLVAVYNGEQLRVMLNALQGNTYGIKKLSSRPVASLSYQTAAALISCSAASVRITAHFKANCARCVSSPHPRAGLFAHPARRLPCVDPAPPLAHR